MAIIDIEDTPPLEIKKWLEDMQNDVNYSGPSPEEELWREASIYRVPAFARDISPGIFTPERVSFGPYHHDVGELKAMEVHKQRALVHFVRKSGKTFNEIFNAVRKVIEELQNSYYHLENRWKSDEYSFSKLMMTDGCFMLEIFDYAANRSGGISEYSPADPFFSEHGVNFVMPYIRRDMLLIENQLPLLLLKTLLSVSRTVEIRQDVDHEIHKLVLNFLTGPGGSFKKVTLCSHPLDLLRHSLLGVPNTRTRNPIRKAGIKSLKVPEARSAIELHEAGIKFRLSRSNSINDISFNESSRILCLPRLVVDDATECMFRNMVLFEHLNSNVGHDVTSYLCFMSDIIIDSAEDVSLLRSRGIIENYLGSYEEAASVFNKITKGMTVDPHSHLLDIHCRVDYTCRRTRTILLAKQNNWCNNLGETYFKSPWAALSLAGALLVIALTILQTVFSYVQIRQN